MEPIVIDANYIKNLNKRLCFDDAKNFLNESQGKSGRIVALYGLRRTGKTILMSQLALEYGINYIHQVTPNDTMDDVYNTIIKEKEKGSNIIFIDEITDAEDFIEDSSLLPNKFAREGIDIVITGTDSLGIFLASRERLLDRLLTIKTTYIPYAEHSLVLKTTNIDEYIKFGGLMRQGITEEEAITDYISARRYLDSAVVGNIIKSLKKAPSIPNYREILKYSQDDLEKIIHKAVEIYSGVFDFEIFNKAIKNTSLSIAMRTFNESNHKDDTVSLDRYSKNAINDTLKKELNLIEGLEREATDLLVIQLETTLRELNFLSEVNVDIFDVRAEKNPFNNSDVFHYNDKEYYIIQPAIKYNHLAKATEILRNNELLQQFPAKMREESIGKLREYILGLMKESIVQYDTSKSLQSDLYYVCKPKYENMLAEKNQFGEFDMLIYSVETNTYFGFEIKHTSNPYQLYDENGNYLDGQDKHLVNNELIEAFNSQFGECEGVFVLYNGEAFVAPNRTIYLNTSDFLLSIYKTNDIHRTIKDLTNGIPPAPLSNFTDVQNNNNKFPVNMSELDAKFHDALHKLILCKYESLRENFLADKLFMIVDGEKNSLLKPSCKVIKAIVNEYKKLPNFEKQCKDFIKSSEGKKFSASLRKTNFR
ncbi:MAG: hypothetical protein E7104_02785 [Prevotella sp.]|nr:hypothetical protein [Prevotella sp.]